MNKYWISWWHREDMGRFDLKWPCWWTGSTCEKPELLAYCAAVKVEQGEDILEIVRTSYSRFPDDIKWRFVIPKSDDWTPYSDRFTKDEDAEEF